MFADENEKCPTTEVPNDDLEIILCEISQHPLAQSS